MTNEYSKALNDLLVEGFRAVTQIEERQLQSVHGIDLSINELHMIEAIGKNVEGALVKDIAKQLQISLPAVTISTKKLEKKGYIVRNRGSHDGRTVRLILTPDGERINHIHAYFHERMLRSITSELSEKDLKVFFDCIYKLDQFFNNQLDKIK